MIHTYTDLHRGEKSDYPSPQYKINSSLFLKRCHNARFYLHKSSNVSQFRYYHFTRSVTWAYSVEQDRARPCLTIGMAAHPGMTRKDAQWELWISQRELTAPELEEAQRGAEMKGRREEEIAAGPFCSPSSQSSRSGDVGTTFCCYQFSFV